MKYTPEEKLKLARYPGRPGAAEFISNLFTDFFEQRGDRQCSDDPCLIGGIARYHGRPVSVVGQQKGRTLEQKMKLNFGMPGPEGYRKAYRIMKQAEKFGRPVITFIDTPGAYPGKEAEERGQGEAIAQCLALMSSLTVPVVAVIAGEANSGGALALGAANRVLMLENAVYSVLSPEGFATILWRDASRSDEACNVMQLTAQDLHRLGVVQEVLREPEGGAHTDVKAVYRTVDTALNKALTSLMKMSPKALVEQRYQLYRSMGQTPASGGKKKGS